MSLLAYYLFSVPVGCQLTVRLKDICSMTKEKTARLIPNAIQVCTDSEKVSEANLGPSTPWHPNPQLPPPHFCSSVLQLHEYGGQEDGGGGWEGDGDGGDHLHWIGVFGV